MHAGSEGRWVEIQKGGRLSLRDEVGEQGVNGLICFNSWGSRHVAKARSTL